MKKVIFVLVSLIPFAVLAQTVITPPATTGIWTYIKTIIMGVLASNIAMTFIKSVLIKVPVIGPFLGEILDYLMANPAHP